MVRDFLQGWGLGHWVDHVRLVVSELVGNAVPHAVPDDCLPRPGGARRIDVQLMAWPGMDVDSGLWVPGIDYMAGWRQARLVADRLNRALLGLGFELSEVRAVAITHTGGRGVGVGSAMGEGHQ